MILLPRAPSMRNVDFKNPVVPIRLLRIFTRKPLLADFCNNIDRSAGRAPIGTLFRS
jgi:hypothetical protein